MKKPITIGVIAVITTILITSAADYSATGAKPTNEVFAIGTSWVNGEIVCPDGFTKAPGDISLSVSFSEEEPGNKGGLLAHDQGVNPQSSIGATFYVGSIENAL